MSGLGSKVSRWLGPPCIKSEMTRLAVPGRGAPCIRSSAASQPMPSPACCRNLRRDSLVDIDKLTQIKNQQAQTREIVLLEISERGLELGGGGAAARPQTPRRTAH